MRLVGGRVRDLGDHTVDVVMRLPVRLVGDRDDIARHGDDALVGRPGLRRRAEVERRSKAKGRPWIATIALGCFSGDLVHCHHNP